MRNYLTIVLLALALGSTARPADSLVVILYDDFIAMVREHHPLAAVAQLKLSEGEAKLLHAKGAFDPKLYAQYSQKDFNDTEYYSILNGGLSVPTWFGLELRGGYENNQGVYLNPELTNPANGLVYAGVSLTLGQGLFIDKRRAELKKAALFQQITEAEQQILMNELVLEAGLSYWNWFRAYNSLLVHREAFNRAHERYQGVKDMAILGERPAIDTVEAHIQVQNRQLSLAQAEMEFNNASALLSVYLWHEGVVPLELTPNAVPPVADEITVTPPPAELWQLRDSVLNTHPELQKAGLNIARLEVEKRWQKEQLKPVVNLKYTPLAEPVSGNLLGNFSLNNYTWGLEFKFPLFLRKERGNLRLTEAKLQQNQFQLSQKQARVRYKVTEAINLWHTTKVQTDIYRKAVENYARLLDGEKELFDSGESSLFMINSREMGYIQGRLKYIDLMTKNFTSALKTRFSLGILAERPGLPQ